MTVKDYTFLLLICYYQEEVYLYTVETILYEGQTLADNLGLEMLGIGLVM